MEERLQIRIHGDASLPALIYLPGLHGDWTLVTSFHLALGGRVRFVEFTYPRTLTWSLDDYAKAIADSLAQNGITRGWLLAESFGSQIAWPLVEGAKREGRGTKKVENDSPLSPLTSHFTVEGLILAGGFVKHPFMWGVGFVEKLCNGVSLAWLKRILFWYAKVSRWRFRHAPEVVESIGEFIARRTELDMRAVTHRLRLIKTNDPRPIACAAALPVFHLSGFWDPIVPWPFVRPWLRRHCPGFREARLFALADHNVLGTAPRTSARRVLEWMSPRPRT
ncbi:MAG: alpha/beta hydrolase [Verrucomicrobia bacterium]|nr:alpha/beta hydrolase [Verrucomicrobiota bacterium]